MRTECVSGYEIVLSVRRVTTVRWSAVADGRPQTAENRARQLARRVTVSVGGERHAGGGGGRVPRIRRTEESSFVSGGRSRDGGYIAVTRDTERVERAAVVSLVAPSR